MRNTKYQLDWKNWFTPSSPKMWKYGMWKYIWSDMTRYWKLFVIFWYELRYNIVIGDGKRPTASFTDWSDTGKPNHYDGSFKVNGNYTVIKYNNISDHENLHLKRDYHYRIYPSIHRMGVVFEEIDKNGYVIKSTSFTYVEIAKLMEMFPWGQTYKVNDMWKIMKNPNNFTYPIK